MHRANILKIIWVFLLVAILVVAFIVHRKSFQPLRTPFALIARLEKNISFSDSLDLITVHNSKDNTVEVNKILEAVNHTISNASFKCLNDTTSAKNSRATILDYRLRYCTGDSLTVQVDMFDYLGKRKTYGGDFLRARIYSPELGAGASGRIEDLNNGTYNIHFILSWEGNVRISILLLHPSEGVSALWKARNIGFKYIIYTGLFLNGTQHVQSECGFSLDSQEEKCEYADKRDGEFFYCIKPAGVRCEALISMMSKNRAHTYLTSLEKDMFIRSNIGVEIPTQHTNIEVVKCQRNTTEVKPKCAIGMSPPFPGGYFLNNLWHSLFCNLSSYEPLSKISTCLSGKMIYLMGDSTIRQWIEYFPKVMKSLKFFDLHGSDKLKTLLNVDMTNNVYIQWKKHGHPLVTQHLFTLNDYASVPREIDRLPGGPYTIVVIALGQHFRPFPLSLFIRRILNVRKALERLFLRSPDTKVIIKSENTREITTDVERFSDFHGYIQYVLVKDIFKGLNVGVIDAWDMTTAFGSYDVHPTETVINNELNLFLAYIC